MSADFTEQTVRAVLATVPDPEVPAISVLDLGIIREVSVTGAGIEITITPTYSGCPAMHEIEQSIRQALYQKGFEVVSIKTVLAPAWTTDWMTADAKAKLKAYGIAPPGSTQEALVQIGARKPIQCPYCDSFNTELRSEFGPTACKALHQCLNCRQPFEQFKPH